MRTVSLCLKTMVLCTGHKKYAGNFHNAAGEREPGESSVRCGRLGRFVCGWLHVCLFLSRETMVLCTGEREPGESSVRCGRLGRFVCGWLHVCLFLSRKTQKAMVGF